MQFQRNLCFYPIIFYKAWILGKCMAERRGKRDLLSVLSAQAVTKPAFSFQVPWEGGTLKRQKEKRQEKETPEKKQQQKEQQETKLAKRQYRDTVFRMLFRDKEHLLELYNAVSGRNCTDPEELEIVTLENAIYMGVKNELAFLVDLRLYLYEHQSTINFNMPIRFLEYVVEEYGRLTAGANIYGSRRIPLPAPHFIVFYNGISPFPERQVMRLSDAFPVREGEPQLELCMLVLNINEGYNTELKKQCRTLGEYMQYVDRVREYAASMPITEAVDRAVDECIGEGILRDFLLANKAEVKHMRIYEYDEEAYRQAIRIEEYERGREEGIEQGIKALILDNMESGFTKEAIIAKLIKRFGLSESNAENCYENARTVLQEV